MNSNKARNMLIIVLVAMLIISYGMKFVQNLIIMLWLPAGLIVKLGEWFSAYGIPILITIGGFMIVFGKTMLRSLTKGVRLVRLR